MHPDPFQFPPGTEVDVYPDFVPRSGVPLEGKPPGTKVEKPTVATNGTLTVKGLTALLQYVGWVGSPDRYLHFRDSS